MLVSSDSVVRVEECGLGPVAHVVEIVWAVAPEATQPVVPHHGVLEGRTKTGRTVLAWVWMAERTVGPVRTIVKWRSFWAEVGGHLRMESPSVHLRQRKREAIVILYYRG